jgi:hypothetical protein
MDRVVTMLAVGHDLTASASLLYLIGQLTKLVLFRTRACSMG